MFVLTFKAKDLDHSIDWYFDVAEEAKCAMAMAQRSPGLEWAKLRDDFMCDSREFENWLIGEGIEPKESFGSDAWIDIKIPSEVTR